MKKITAEMLREAGACQIECGRFARVFPNGASTESDVQVAVEHKFYLELAAKRFLRAPALAEYDKVRAPTWAEYDKVRAQAWADYEKVRAQAWADYEKVRAQALAECEKVRAAAFFAAWKNQEEANP